MLLTEDQGPETKRLAYEIQKMREGFYYFIQFDADAECPAEIEKRLRIMDNVLRYLCVKQDPRQVQPVQAEEEQQDAQ